jgi:hypothetical protein
MKLSARVSGDFAALIEAELRGQIVGAGLGERPARTWRRRR